MINGYSKRYFKVLHDKKDIKRFPVAPKEYLEHQVNVLEKNGTHAYNEFNERYPDIMTGKGLLKV